LAKAREVSLIQVNGKKGFPLKIRVQLAGNVSKTDRTPNLLEAGSKNTMAAAQIQDPRPKAKIDTMGPHPLDGILCLHGIELTVVSVAKMVSNELGQNHALSCVNRGQGVRQAMGE